MTDAKPQPGDALAPLEERLAVVKGTRIRYFVGGAGTPLVLVHGLGGAASNWVELVGALAARHRVLALDLPGHGGSGPLPAAPTLEPYADRIARLAEREGLGRYALVGHSLGGVVALRVAMRAGDAVSGVVLVSAAGIVSSSRWAELVLTYAAWARPGWALAPFRQRIARRPRLRALLFRPWAVADARSLSVRAVEGLLEGPGLHTDTIGATRALVADDPRLELEHVRCPCLVLAGARDPQVPFADSVEYARRLRAPLRVIPDCGHLAIVERPDACAHAIETFAGGL